MTFKFRNILTRVKYCWKYEGFEETNFLSPSTLTQRLNDMWNNAILLGGGTRRKKKKKIHLEECLDGIFNILKCR